MSRLLSFDIEISNVFELGPGEDFEQYAPFDISVAATAIDEGKEIVWLSRGDDEEPLRSMLPGDARAYLEYLHEKQQQGLRICAWNGLSFDLRWIGHAARDMELAGEVALGIFDPMFQFFVQRGFPVGLAKVAEGMGIQQKKLIAGEDAPRLWRDGQYQTVMDYVVGDCQMTNRVVNAIVGEGGVCWITRAGKQSFERMLELLPVREVLRLPMADQSWMDTPIPREQFTRWLPQGMTAAG